MSEIAARLAAIKERIAYAAKDSGRDPRSVTLVAVSKTHDAATIAPVLAAGHRVFGENRVQEAASKWPALRQQYAGIELHLVGPLQTNKVRDALALFDVIESLDRPKLAQALAAELAKSPRRIGCYIQVNTGEEPQKAGVLPDAADAFIVHCRDELKLPIAGLMCIPPQDEEPSLHFALLGEIARRSNLHVLSMGMSSDYEIAVRLGATHVRIGTAIFGARPAAAEG